MRFRVPALDQSDCSICYNYDLKYVYYRGHTLPIALAILAGTNLAGMTKLNLVLILAGKLILSNFDTYKVSSDDEPYLSMQILTFLKYRKDDSHSATRKVKATPTN